jgi:hypothetical protein
MKSVTLRINKPKVISEVFEDEVVAINLGTGTYFGMAGTAKEVWRLIEAGVPVKSMVTYLAQCYGVPDSQMSSDIEAFAESLAGHELASRIETDGPAPEIESHPIAGSWSLPVISIYDDMQDLLLLDPIHDVDETGWPAIKPDGAH